MKSESEVTQLCPTLSDPMDCSPPGPSVCGIFQARVLEWGAIAYSSNMGQSCLINDSPCFLLKIILLVSDSILKKAFLSDQCKEIEENNRMAKTRDQYSCLEIPMDGGAWWAAVHGVAKSRTRLRDFTFTFHFHALEKEMATHSSVLAWRIPGMG